MMDQLSAKPKGFTLMQAMAVPPDAVALETEGFHAHAESRWDGGWVFMLYQPDSERVRIARVNMPLANEYHTPGQRPDGALVALESQRSSMYPRNARAVAEVIVLAAGFAGALNQSCMGELSKQNEEYRQKRTQDASVAKAKEAARNELFESIKWMIEDQIRLRRYNMRSTVFGTIKDVIGPDKTRVPYMNIITERGKPMHIKLADICLLEKKEENRRYTKIYENGEVIA